MGDPRKHRKKFERPPHPWQGARIEKEKEIVKKYGLIRKKEVWKMDSLLREFKRQAKSLITRTDPQSKKEEDLLLKKLYGLGVIGKDAKIEEILDLSTQNILDRRLQTVIVAKGLARTPKQARQLIVHCHILVNGKRMTIPSYIVKRSEEDKLEYDANSPFANPDHPERTVEKKEKGKVITPLAPKGQKVENTPIVVEA
jgi:small subunit ribosomal protein S4